MEYMHHLPTWDCSELVVFLCSGKCLSEVERSLCYCLKHHIAPDADQPKHAEPVFHPALIQRWREKYATQFPDLESSREIMKEVLCARQELPHTSQGLRSIALWQQASAQ